MILTACAELVLVFALVYALWQLYREQIEHTKAPQAASIFALLFLALLTIAITASFGALRYYALTPEAPADLISKKIWGFRLDDLHDGLSSISRNFAMPIYLFATVWLWGRLPLWFAPALLAMALLPQLGLFGLFTDAALILMLLALLQNVAARRWVVVAIVWLLAVPFCIALIPNNDVAMAFFHLCLAAHFMSYAQALPKLAKA
jgi:hypothetical protein